MPEVRLGGARVALVGERVVLVRGDRLLLSGGAAERESRPRHRRLAELGVGSHPNSLFEDSGPPDAAESNVEGNRRRPEAVEELVA
ncbi:MAG: hypothetical protein L0206_01720 [Actinobacteria bacterium]|nr:hypothetical protein [Actinomycetota bacterium]